MATAFERAQALAAEWRAKPRNPAMDPRAVYLIAKRRRQMLIHSFIYYELNDNIITDELWTRWAQQLARVQNKYGKRIGFFDKLFADWDGSTGHHLVAKCGPDVARVAQRTLDYDRSGRFDVLVGKKQAAEIASNSKQLAAKYGVVGQ